MGKKNIFEQVNEKCEKQMSEGQFSSLPEQAEQQTSKKAAKKVTNQSAEIIGIDTPLHFTSF